MYVLNKQYELNTSAVLRFINKVVWFIVFLLVAAVMGLYVAAVNTNPQTQDFYVKGH